MPSAKRPSRSALVALRDEIKADASLSLEIRSRLSWGIGRELVANPGMSAIEEEIRAALWRLVVGLQGGGKDLLTRTRTVAELIRGVNALRTLTRTRPFGGRKAVPPVRRIETSRTEPA
jgi:hypothetical protein